MMIRHTRDTLSPVYLDALKIRHLVFVEGQGVPLRIEIDENEALCIHFVLYDDQDRPLATCRLLPQNDRQVLLQRMAVLPDYQGQALGSQLLKEASQFAKELGYEEISLHAQVSAQTFYQKLGYSSFGDLFEEAGIQHVHMKKRL